MNRTVVHDTFVIERDFPVPAARVFAAFADPAAKAVWFGDPDLLASAQHDIDFRIGGREFIRADAPSGPTFTYDAVYCDIVENGRIVYTYEMTMGGRRISVSVATLEFVADGSGTHFILTEQGTYLDGLDTSAIRAHGTAEMIDGLGRYLAGTDTP